MPEFPTIRPNDTKWQLKSEQLEEFDEVIAMYEFWTGRPLSQKWNSVLLACYKFCGKEKTLHYLERWSMLGYYSPDSLVKLCKGEIPTERSLNKQRVEEMPGKGRAGTSASTKPLAEFLAENPEKILKPVKKLPAGWYRREDAAKWMSENHPNDLDKFEEFFSYLGFHEGCEIYQLIVRQ